MKPATYFKLNQNILKQLKNFDLLFNFKKFIYFVFFPIFQVKFSKRPELCRKVEREGEGKDSRRRKVHKTLNRGHSLQMKEGLGEPAVLGPKPDLQVKGF